MTARWKTQDLEKKPTRAAPQKKTQSEEKPFEVLYTGTGIGSNQVRGDRWRKSHAKIKGIKEHMLWILKLERLPQLGVIRLEVSFNAGYDIDNAMYMAKIFVDCLRLLDLIKDDTKEYFRFISIQPDETLPKQTFKFRIRGNNKF